MVFRLLVAALLAGSVQFAYAGDMAQGSHQNQHHDMQSMTMDAQQGAAAMPHEGGQSAFAAIQEIVNILMADPNTDWSKVNIPALQAHLRDMDAVTLHSHSVASYEGNKAIFTVTGKGGVVGSIQRMVMAHVATMQGVNGIHFEAEKIKNGVRLTAVAPDHDTLVRLKGLGFIGVMVLGSHHQMHHLMIARGGHPHNG